MKTLNVFGVSNIDQILEFHGADKSRHITNNSNLNNGFIEFLEYQTIKQAVIVITFMIHL